MERTQNIEQEIENIKKLRKYYESFVSERNRQDAIDAYHKWHEASCILFSRYFDASCKEYANFAYIDNSGNGFDLYNNYQGIRKDFCVLIDKLERSDVGKIQHSDIEQTSQVYSSSKKRIFISHASKDRGLIDKFVDSIILLGMGIESKSIAYTSREDTGVPPGQSIPQFIQYNIACADVVLLMISDNYKKSEVCLNEMGAAWALNKHIIQILLPNTSIDRLGWLCSLEKAIKIDEAESMDSLCEVFTERLDIGVKPSVWNRNKKSFLTYSQTLTSVVHPDVIESVAKQANCDDTHNLGILDYRLMLDANNKEVLDICNTLTQAIYKNNDNLSSNTQKLQEIVTDQTTNVSHAIDIIKSTAAGMDELSIKLEQNTSLLKSAFFSMIDNAVNIEALNSSYYKEEKIQEEYNNISELLICISTVKLRTISYKGYVDSLPKIEQSFTKSQKRLSENLASFISILDECISKGQELSKSIL